MFRKGGNVGEGIMTGIVDREMHAVSDPNGVGGQTLSTEERLQKAYDKYPDQSIDPIAQLLIQGGLGAMSTTGGGSTIGNIAKAFKDPTDQLFKNLNSRGKDKRNLALEGAILDIGQEGKEALLEKEIQARIDLEAGKIKPNPLYELQLGEEVETYSGQPQVAERAAKFKTTESDNFYKKVGGKRAGGVLTFDISDPEQVKANKSFFKKMDGKFVYDPYADNYKKISFKKGVIGQPTTYMDIKSINLNDTTGDPGAPELSEFAKQTELGILKWREEQKKLKEEQEKLKKEKQRQSVSDVAEQYKNVPSINDDFL
jgi:hypothetical protein